MKYGKLPFFFIFIFITTSCSQIDTNMSEPMKDFEFTSQDNQTISLEDMDGEWWIANMVYTNCRTVCPRTTAQLVKVQDKLQQKDFYPPIISFSVDPDYDKPEVLKEYAKEEEADVQNWNFLTGYDFDKIQKIARESFKTTLSKGAADQISHGYSTYLINPDGQIVKEYDGMSSAEMDQLIDDIKSVL